MQNKGIVKFIAVALILVCCFYLSFSKSIWTLYLPKTMYGFGSGVSTSAVRWRLAWVLT